MKILKHKKLIMLFQMEILSKNITLDNVLTIVSIFISTLLTILIIYISVKESKRQKSKDNKDLKQTLFIVRQEVKDIFIGFYNILMSNKGKNIHETFYFDSDWRKRIIRLVPHLPEEVSNELYLLYSFCEYSNKHNLNYSRYNNHKQLIRFVEINNIEYIADKSLADYLPNYKIRFLNMFLEEVILTNIKNIDNYSLKIVGDYDKYTINSIEFSDIINEIKLSTKYSDGLIKEQKAIKGEELIRNVKFDSEGYATGYDRFKISGNYNYLRNYRKPYIDLSGIFISIEQKHYQGHIVKNNKHGLGKIYLDDQIIEDGTYTNNNLYNGNKYQVEINRKYLDPKLQSEYDYKKYASSDDYIEKSIEEDEKRYEYDREHNYEYTSIRVNQRIEEGKAITVKGTKLEVKVGPYF